jgi:death-on-curing protein
VSEPYFLSFEQVQEIHQEAIKEFGGTLGIRDRGALDSAIFHPQNVYFYGGGDLCDIAAAYAYHIAEAQAFLDGNKRSAVGAALTFLEGNGIRTDCGSQPLYEAMIAIAEKRLSRTDLADLLRQLLRP